MTVNPRRSGGGDFKAAFNFFSHAFNFRATLLCLGDFSQKNSFTPCGKKLF